jgi:hypothetical protein
MGFFRRSPKKKSELIDLLPKIKSLTWWIVPRGAVQESAGGYGGGRWRYLVFGRSGNVANGSRIEEIEGQKILIVRPDHYWQLAGEYPDRLIYAGTISEKDTGTATFSPMLKRGLKLVIKSVKKLESSGRADGLVLLQCAEAKDFLEFIYGLKRQSRTPTDAQTKDSSKNTDS